MLSLPSPAQDQSHREVVYEGCEGAAGAGAGRAGEERRHTQDKLAKSVGEEGNMRPNAILKMKVRDSRGREEGMRNMCLLNSSDSDSSGGTLYSQLHQISEEDDKREASDSSSLSSGGGREAGRKVTPCVKTANATSDGHATSFSTRKNPSRETNRPTANRPTSLMRVIFRKMTVSNSKSAQDERLKELEEEEGHKKVKETQAVEKSREERLHLEEEERTREGKQRQQEEERMQAEKQRQQEKEELRRPEQQKREVEEETQVAERRRTEEKRRRAAEFEEKETRSALETQRQERAEEENRWRKVDRLGRGEKATKCEETELYRTLQAQSAFNESKVAIASLCKASSDKLFASSFLEGLDFQNLPPNNGENPSAQEQQKSQVKSTEGEVPQVVDICAEVLSKLSCRKVNRGEVRGDFLHDDAVTAFVTSALKNACPEKLLARSICESSHNLDVSLHPWDRRGKQAVQSTPSPRRENHSQCAGPNVFASMHITTGTLYDDAIKKFKKCLTSYEMDSEVLGAQSVLFHSTSSSSFPLTDGEAFQQEEEQEKEQKLSKGAFEASAKGDCPSVVGLKPSYMTKANARTSDESSSPTSASPTSAYSPSGDEDTDTATYLRAIEVHEKSRWSQKAPNALGPPTKTPSVVSNSCAPGEFDTTDGGYHREYAQSINLTLSPTNKKVTPTRIDLSLGEVFGSCNLVGSGSSNANLRNHIENLASEEQKDSRMSEMSMVQPWVISKVGEASRFGMRGAAVDTVLPASSSSRISRGVLEVKPTIAAAVSPPPPRFVVNPTSHRVAYRLNTGIETDKDITIQGGR